MFRAKLPKVTSQCLARLSPCHRFLHHMFLQLEPVDSTASCASWKVGEEGVCVPARLHDADYSVTAVCSSITPPDPSVLWTRPTFTMHQRRPNTLEILCMRLMSGFPVLFVCGVVAWSYYAYVVVLCGELELLLHSSHLIFLMDAFLLQESILIRSPRKVKRPDRFCSVLYFPTCVVSFRISQSYTWQCIMYSWCCT